ncbi:MAG: hypothetical protein RLZZ458_1678 [Planctomycetota bacterium]
MLTLQSTPVFSAQSAASIRQRPPHLIRSYSFPFRLGDSQSSQQGRRKTEHKVQTGTLKAGRPRTPAILLTSTMVPPALPPPHSQTPQTDYPIIRDFFVSHDSPEAAGAHRQQSNFGFPGCSGFPVGHSTPPVSRHVLIPAFPAGRLAVSGKFHRVRKNHFPGHSAVLQAWPQHRPCAGTGCIPGFRFLISSGPKFRYVTLSR